MGGQNQLETGEDTQDRKEERLEYMNKEVGQDEKLEVETGRGEQDCYRTGHFACFDYNDQQLWDWQQNLLLNVL